MAFSVFRLDAIYTAPFGVPALALVGRVAELIHGAYRAFSDRYSFIRPEAFRALNSNILSEIGIGVSLLERRLEIQLRVDQFTVQATNLRHPYEIRFAQDCALLMHGFVESQIPEATIGTVNLRIASWLIMDGGTEQVTKVLNKVAKPARTTLDQKQFGDSVTVEYWTKVLLKDTHGGWQLTVGVEPSAIPDAHLYILRDYIFEPASWFDTPEKKMAFLESSTTAICSWLGIEPATEAP